MKKMIIFLAIVFLYTPFTLAKQTQNKEIVELSSKELSKTLPQVIDKYTTYEIASQNLISYRLK